MTFAYSQAYFPRATTNTSNSKQTWWRDYNTNGQSTKGDK